MIETRGLTKRFGPLVAVRDISFAVKKGAILGFIGPNGAGKTTTMRMITGYLPATEGDAIVAGFDVFEHPMEVKRRVGYLPERPPVYPELTVGDYLAFIADIREIPRRRSLRTNTLRLQGDQLPTRRSNPVPLDAAVQVDAPDNRKCVPVTQLHNQPVLQDRT